MKSNSLGDDMPSTAAAFPMQLHYPESFVGVLVSKGFLPILNDKFLRIDGGWMMF